MVSDCVQIEDGKSFINNRDKYRTNIVIIVYIINLVTYLQSIGKRVLLIMVMNHSNDLRKNVDEWRHLGQLKLIREKK